MDKITSTLERELKLRTPCKDPEEMLKSLARIYGAEETISEITIKLSCTQQTDETGFEYSPIPFNILERLLDAQRDDVHE